MKDVGLLPLDVKASRWLWLGLSLMASACSTVGGAASEGGHGDFACIERTITSAAAFRRDHLGGGRYLVHIETTQDEVLYRFFLATDGIPTGGGGEVTYRCADRGEVGREFYR